ncbi:hypothetical protein CBW53_02875 [Yersinia frederiksenii]|nr:hypothetical protein CBW53_02875 [Yersinia frederiksenii]
MFTVRAECNDSLNDVMLLDFHGESFQIQLFENNFYVVVSQICKNIGLNSDVQINFIISDDILKDSSLTLNGDVFLLVTYLNGWLFNINKDELPVSVSNKLFFYKRNCYEFILHHIEFKNINRILIPGIGRWLVIYDGSKKEIIDVKEKDFIDSDGIRLLRRDTNRVRHILSEFNERLGIATGDVDKSIFDNPL